MEKRDNTTYDFKVGDTIKHSGRTTDEDRRESEHQQRWPTGRLVKVGTKKTKKAAIRWEGRKRKAITPRRSSGER